MEPLVKKSLRISRWQQQRIKPSLGPFERRPLSKKLVLPSGLRATLGKGLPHLPPHSTSCTLGGPQRTRILNILFWIGQPKVALDMQEAKDREIFLRCFSVWPGGTGADRSVSVALCPRPFACEPCTQQTFPKLLLCAKHCSRSWEHSRGQNKIPAFAAHILLGDTRQ